MRVLSIQQNSLLQNKVKDNLANNDRRLNTAHFQHFKRPDKATLSLGAGLFLALSNLAEVLNTKLSDIRLLFYPEEVRRGLIYSKERDGKDVYNAKKELVDFCLTNGVINKSDLFFNTCLYRANDMDVLKEKRATADYILSCKELTDSYSFMKYFGQILFRYSDDKDAQKYKRTILGKIVQNKEYTQVTPLYQESGKIVALIQDKANYVIVKHILDNDKLCGNRSVIEGLRVNLLRTFAINDNKELAAAKMEVLDKYAEIEEPNKNNSLYFSIGEIAAYTTPKNKELVLKVLSNPRLYSSRYVVSGIKEAIKDKDKLQYLNSIVDVVEREELSPQNPSVAELLKNVNNDYQVSTLEYILHNKDLVNNETVQEQLANIVVNVENEEDKKLVVDLLKNEKLVNAKKIISNVGSLLKGVHSNNMIKYLAQSFIYNFQTMNTIALFDIINLVQQNK